MKKKNNTEFQCGLGLLDFTVALLFLLLLQIHSEVRCGKRNVTLKPQNVRLVFIAVAVVCALALTEVMS